MRAIYPTLGQQFILKMTFFAVGEILDHAVVLHVPYKRGGAGV